MVKALHRAGIEVILDVVFNHTAEGGTDGPTISFRGFDNDATTCSRTTTGRLHRLQRVRQHGQRQPPVVRRLILDCLRYWVQHMHVDGFRFDLASMLSRGEDDIPLADPPILWDIDTDPVLAGTKIIAEAWDAAGLYQVGSFAGDRWAEWNGRYRDDVRRFVKGDDRTGSASPTRSAGARTCSATRLATRSAASTSSTPTTASPSTISSRSTTSTTTPTARTTATAATRTTAGTAASRDRPTTPRCRRSAAARSGTCSRSSCSRRDADAGHGRRSPSDPARQQ